MSENSTNPFKGLHSYGPNDSSKLFGRERDLILMKDRIFSARTTLLFAGSGVGKTSFLNAKVIPDLKGQYSTFYHSRWAGPSKPLEAVKTTLAESIENAEKSERLIGCFEDFVYKPPSDSAIFNEGGDGVPAAEQCLLIFDQFEEIFQYHAYEDYFKRFLNEVCEVVRRDEYRVHLVISMREEYLGELSVFDNLIPDLFNNYYRLRYPNKRDAAQIIEGTCRTASATVHRENLKELISDLAKIEKGVASAAERSTRDDKAVGHVVERNFIIPPYLQIVCHRQWEDQAKRAGNNGENGMVFLESYQANQAQTMLRDYCQEKLSALSFMEQNVAERSFDFLVTKQGAKMAYEFTSLVEHMRLRFFKGKLKDALNKLSVPETRILRKSHGPDGSVWFELYHDIYGKILDTWRASFRARKHRLTILLGIVALVLLLILIPISWHWGLKPYNSRKTLMMAHLEKPEEYGRAVEAYESLSGTLGYGSIANSLMADAWERRARYAESRNQRDEATISWLKALSLKPDAPHGDLWRLKAGNLIGDDYQRVNHRWYHENRVTNAIFSDNAQLVATQTDDERIWIWDVESGTLIGKHADPQDSEPPEPVQADKTPPLGTPSSLRRQGPTNERAEPKSHIIQGVALNQELGWLVAITFNEGDTDQPDSGSRRRSPEDISPQPVLVLSNNDELVNSGIEAEKKRSSNFVDAELSSDGRFIATSGRGQKIRVWRIGEGKASPVEGFRTERFITNVTFSPDAKSLVMESETGRLSMWDVASGRLRYELPASGRKDELAFSSDSDSFAVSYYVNSNHLLVEVRNTETGEPLRTPVPIKKLGVWYGRLALGAENKVLVFTRNEDVWSVDPISGEVRQTVRVNARENPITSLGLSREVALTVLENEVRLHRVELETVRNPMLNPGENMGTSVLSEDGTRITTLIAKPKPDKSPYKPDKPQMHRLQVLDATTLAPIGDAIDNVLVLSDNGEYVATIDPEKPPDKRRRTKEKDDNELTIQILNVKNKSEVMKFQYPDVHGFTRLVSSASGKFFATYKLTRDTSYDSDFYRYLYYRGMMPSEESQDLEDGYIYVWDRDDPSRPMTSKIEITNAQQYTCAFSRDERFFAVSATSTTGIALWDLEKMQPLQLTKDLGRAGTLAFSERGQLIAGASNKLRTWDLTTRQPVNELDTLTRINAVALDSDSRTILTGDVSGNVSLWKFSPNGSASPVGEVRHRDPSNSVTFSVDKSVGIISAGKWLHTTNVSNHQYLQSYFLGSTWSGQCRSMSDSGAQFRCLFKLPNGELKIKDIKAGEIQDDVRLEGDAHALLETWSKRLGLFINNLGKIVPLESGAASVVTTGHTL